MAKYLLLDAHALIHRAYHAVPTSFTSPTGEPTNATYGFTNTLLKVFADERPDFVAAAFDVGTPARQEKFAEYKATRPQLANDLVPQLARSRDICRALSIPDLGVRGVEADDIIGALATQAVAEGLEVVIVTGDTDAFQLIDERVRVLTFSRQFGDTVIYDLARVRERYGLEPAQLIDLKALRGDNSDNIPGVKGIGDKTATRLLQTYGTVEELYARLDELDPKTQEKLAPFQEQVRLSKDLVTIDRSTPVVLDLESARFGGFDREKVANLFRDLGFRTLMTRVDGLYGTHAAEAKDEEAQAQAPEATARYSVVDTQEKLRALAKKMARHDFVVDVETTSLRPLEAELVGIAIALGGGEAYYIPLGHVPPPPPPEPKKKGSKKAKESQAELVLTSNLEPPVPAQVEPVPQLDRRAAAEILKPAFANVKVAKYAHNANYDLLVLEGQGITVRNLAFDTLVAAHLVEPPRHPLGLKSLVWSKFGFEMTEIEGLIGKGANQLSMSQVSVEQAGRYACADADYTFRLVELYRDQIEARGLHKLFFEVEMPLVPVLVEMERAGVLLDLEALQGLSQTLAERMKALERQIYDCCGTEFNLASPIQLSEALFGKLALPVQGIERTRTGQISTRAEVLESLREKHPVIPMILEHRELAKLKGTYVDALPALVDPKTGRVHTSYNQTGAVTGRLSSSDPNLQNIPARSELGRLVRRAFVAAPGTVLVSADYSQVELRILAHMSGDQNLLDAFGRNEDIHASTAGMLFDVPIGQVTPAMRDLGKRINFGVVYGISDWGIASRTDLSVQDSRQLIANYLSKYSGVQGYMERTKRQARELGYVETLLGRRRYFPELGGRVNIGVRNQAEREAINMPIQGTAADIMKLAMINLFNELQRRKLGARLTLQVHDELVIETPEKEVAEVAALACEVMENAFPLSTRLKTDVKTGTNWDQMHPYP